MPCCFLVSPSESVGPLHKIYGIMPLVHYASIDFLKIAYFFIQDKKRSLQSQVLTIISNTRNKGMTGPFQWRIQGRGLGAQSGMPPRKKILRQGAPFSQGLDDPFPTPLSEGLDPPLLLKTQQNNSIVQKKKISRQAQLTDDRRHNQLRQFTQNGLSNTLLT